MSEYLQSLIQILFIEFDELMPSHSQSMSFLSHEETNVSPEFYVSRALSSKKLKKVWWGGKNDILLRFLCFIWFSLFICFLNCIYILLITMFSWFFVRLLQRNVILRAGCYIFFGLFCLFVSPHWYFVDWLIATQALPGRQLEWGWQTSYL